MYGSSRASAASLTIRSTEAAQTFTPHRSSSSRALSRRDIRAAVSVAAAAATAGPNAPAGTPAGRTASVREPQAQRVRIRRCSVTSTLTTTSVT